MNRLRKTFGIVSAVLLLTLALASPAALAQSGQDGYVSPGPDVIDDTDDSGPASDPATASDTNDTNDSGTQSELPFTGLDLGLVGVAGASLLVLGFGMRRLTRES